MENNGIEYAAQVGSFRAFTEKLSQTSKRKLDTVVRELKQDKRLKQILKARYRWQKLEKSL